MNLRACIRTTAWLGLIAMWLVVLAPLVSQLVMAERAHQPVAALCSAAEPVDSTLHHTLDSALSACGYCDLLATHTAVPPLPVVIPALFALVIAALVPALISRFTPLGAFPSGRPRAPPIAC
ncbi:hypothetical protein FHX57_006354 [Paraburkholderia tropica]|uniref:DUF2946 domain-containing protein n=1 Tax=Paraburkholderia tropica TaxID=92647 RepID=UPI00161A0046|nr:DUF2946 domain-containing protein [Paraburkholderia tropica]MBB2984551.1 hypothetical protein [Paraburkholderia tropica]MBB3003975.1 hypothetical protein [Paraburkholderia tropica]MBB6323429.1 hypothetical protein [Paraburkholderia tropica]